MVPNFKELWAKELQRNLHQLRQISVGENNDRANSEIGYFMMTIPKSSKLSTGKR